MANQEDQETMTVHAFPWPKESIPQCNYCSKSSHFVVKFEHDDACRGCGPHINLSENVYLCRMDCKGLYYDIEEYSVNKDHEVIAEYLCEKDDCYNCGCRIMYMVEARGFQIQEQPPPLPPRPSKVQRNVETFIKDVLVAEELGKIDMGMMIHAYKVHFSVESGMNKSKKKQLNREIGTAFHEKLKSQKHCYIGVSFFT